MPASRQATGVGLPCAIDTSIWRSSVTICSALNLFFGMTQAPFQAHSLTTLGSKKPGQVTDRDYELCWLLAFRSLVLELSIFHYELNRRLYQPCVYKKHGYNDALR